MNDSQILTRKTAASGRVDYGKPITLYESSKTRVEVIPWYVPHNHGSELAIKLRTFKKGEPPLDWYEVEEKSITLNDTATLRLKRALSSLFAVNDEEEGNYLVVKLNGQEVDMNGVDPEQVTSALVGALSQQDVLQHLKGTEISSELANALRASVRLAEMKSAMSELRMLLDVGEAREQAYQEWCEKHPWAFGNQFIVNDEIRNITTQDQVDMLVPRILAGYRDIVELKRPDHNVLDYDKSHRDYFFSRELSKAIGQCHRYLDVFYDAAKHGLLGSEQIVAYHPEATIVIGRSKDWGKDQIKALHGLNARMNGIRVITYDHLLVQGDSLIEYLSNNNESNQ